MESFLGFCRATLLPGLTKILPAFFKDIQGRLVGGIVFAGLGGLGFWRPVQLDSRSPSRLMASSHYRGLEGRIELPGTEKSLARANEICPRERFAHRRNMPSVTSCAVVSVPRRSLLLRKQPPARQNGLDRNLFSPVLPPSGRGQEVLWGLRPLGMLVWRVFYPR